MTAKVIGQVQPKNLESPIPAEMRSVPQWVGWLSVVGEGSPVRLPNGRMTPTLKRQIKPHKLPIDPRTGGLAATTRAATWSSFEDAQAAAQKWSLTGIGFVFADSDPYVGVDIDNCRNPETGNIADWAWKIIQVLNSYTEVSPSGTGVHTILRGRLPAGRGNQAALHGGKVEMFCRERYFTFTGIHVDGTPVDIRDGQVELLALHSELFASRNSSGAVIGSGPVSTLQATDTELIEYARRARNGAKFERLWSGQWKGDYPSQSEAELGLCCLLAFWAGKDAARIDSLFRQSGLMREKWDNQSYRERTLQAAVAHSSESYKPGRRSSSKSQALPRQEDGQVDVAQDVPNVLFFPHTDTGNGERLLRLYGSDIHFC